jgi:lathosterol oxidase
MATDNISDHWIVYALGSVVRYVVIAGLAYIVCYKVWPKELSSLKIQSARAAPAMMRAEVLHSLSTMAIFAAITWMVLRLESKGLTLIYRDIATHSAGYFVLSIVLMIFLHDAYFYWTHRLMHEPWLFRRIHATHHRSTNPTPWAAFSFHPGEAVVEGGIIVLIVVTIPCHPSALGLFLLYMTFITVMGHLGYEIIPSRFRKSRMGQLQNTATNHDVHHRHARYNYGLYFTLWDRLMGTQHRDDD